MRNWFLAFVLALISTSANARGLTEVEAKRKAAEFCHGVGLPFDSKNVQARLERGNRWSFFGESVQVYVADDGHLIHATRLHILDRKKQNEKLQRKSLPKSTLYAKAEAARKKAAPGLNLVPWNTQNAREGYVYFVEKPFGYDAQNYGNGFTLQFNTKTGQVEHASLKSGWKADKPTIKITKLQAANAALKAMKQHSTQGQMKWPSAETLAAKAKISYASPSGTSASAIRLKRERRLRPVYAIKINWSTIPVDAISGEVYEISTIKSPPRARPNLKRV